MKKLLFLCLCLCACATTRSSIYDEVPEAPASLIRGTLAVEVHNESTSDVVLYTSPRPGNKHRVASVNMANRRLPLTRFDMDEMGCLQLLVHHIGDAQGYQDWASPRLCLMPGTVFDLTISEQSRFNSLVVYPDQR